MRILLTADNLSQNSQTEVRITADIPGEKPQIVAVASSGNGAPIGEVARAALAQLDDLAKNARLKLEEMKLIDKRDTWQSVSDTTPRAHDEKSTQWPHDILHHLQQEGRIDWYGITRTNGNAAVAYSGVAEQSMVLNLLCRSVGRPPGTMVTVEQIFRASDAPKPDTAPRVHDWPRNILRGLQQAGNIAAYTVAYTNHRAVVDYSGVAEERMVRDMLVFSVERPAGMTVTVRRLDTPSSVAGNVASTVHPDQWIRDALTSRPLDISWYDIRPDYRSNPGTSCYVVRYSGSAPEIDVIRLLDRARIGRQSTFIVHKMVDASEALKALGISEVDEKGFEQNVAAIAHINTACGLDPKARPNATQYNLKKIASAIAHRAKHGVWYSTADRIHVEHFIKSMTEEDLVFSYEAEVENALTKARGACERMRIERDTHSKEKRELAEKFNAQTAELEKIRRQLAEQSEATIAARRDVKAPEPFGTKDSETVRQHPFRKGFWQNVKTYRNTDASGHLIVTEVCTDVPPAGTRVEHTKHGSKIVPIAPAFKVGDRVIFDGRKATIVSCMDRAITRPWLIRFDGDLDEGPSGHATASNNMLTHEPVAPPAFKIGDRVRSKSTGGEGVYVAINTWRCEKTGTRGGKHLDGQIYGIGRDDLVKIESAAPAVPSQPAFKVGDRVTHIGGSKGQIIGTRVSALWPWNVRFATGPNAGATGWFGAHELTLVE